MDMATSAAGSTDALSQFYPFGVAVFVAAALGGHFSLSTLLGLLWPARFHLAALLAVLAVAEACFYVCWYRSAYRKLNAIPSKCEPDGFTAAAALQSWANFLTLVTSSSKWDSSRYLSLWFCNARFEDIKRGNIEEMLVYGFWYKRRDEMVGDLAHIPELMVAQLEAALGVKFKPGYTPGLRFMSHLWEDLKAQWHPLCMYLAMELVHVAQRVIMTSFGFRYKKFGHLGYYTLDCGVDAAQQLPSTRTSVKGAAATVTAFFDAQNTIQQQQQQQPANATDGSQYCPSPFAAASSIPASIRQHMQLETAKHACALDSDNPLQSAFSQSSSSQATPILFLHGVGGLFAYLEMLKHVIALGHPCIVLECKHVSLRLCSYIPTVDEITAELVSILDKEGIDNVCVVSHSYGSFIASRLNTLHRHRVHSLCLIDPVCLAMFMPQLLHNFMYRQPRLDWKHPGVLVRDLVLWFASRDIHVAATFSRRFYWSDLNLWPADLPPGCCVLLSGNDDLLCSEEVKKMLDALGHVKVILNPHLFHGAFLLDRETKASLMDEVAVLLASGGSLVARLAASPGGDHSWTAALSHTAALSLLIKEASSGHGSSLRRASSSTSSRHLHNTSSSSHLAGICRRTQSMDAGSISSFGSSSISSSSTRRSSCSTGSCSSLLNNRASSSSQPLLWGPADSEAVVAGMSGGTCDADGDGALVPVATTVATASCKQ